MDCRAAGFVKFGGAEYILAFGKVVAAEPNSTPGTVVHID
jgi:hypothetical protein